MYHFLKKLLAIRKQNASSISNKLRFNKISICYFLEAYVPKRAQHDEEVKKNKITLLSIIRILLALMTVSVLFVGFGHQLFNLVPLYPDIDVLEGPYGRIVRTWIHSKGPDGDLRGRSGGEVPREEKKVLSTSRSFQLLVVSQSAPVMVWFFEV
ncbi:uncharacterized protein NPIL_580841 [Nephila pilipes]|uniref:Uncharacterized protein n=1 Tax=Nephila pilipes TaxID=299642 RepID=A0A8X6UFP0_NEPPI|nr:uncharacterized protein NPIL_580841 [Nephila pilipes]